MDVSGLVREQKNRRIIVNILFPSFIKQFQSNKLLTRFGGVGGGR